MGLKQFFLSFFVFIFSIFFLNIQVSASQAFGKRLKVRSSWEVGVSCGISRFINTINPNLDAAYDKFNYWNPDFNAAFSLSIIKSISPSMNAEIRWFTTKLSGSWNPDNGYPVPPLALTQGLVYPNPFKTGINQFDLLLSLNLFQVFAPNRSFDQMNLFVKGGAGAVIVRDYEALYPNNQGNHMIDYALVYGGEFSYQINSKIKIKIEAFLNRVESDRLDGIQQLLPGQNISDPNPFYFYNLKERYFSSTIGMTYTFGWVRKTHFSKSTRSCAVYAKPNVRKVRKRY
jgi:hypothetical protein